METPVRYTRDELEKMLSRLTDEDSFGIVLRAKGVIRKEDGGWMEFDYVPEEMEIRDASADVTGKFCVIGSKLNEDNLEKLFRRKL